MTTHLYLISAQPTPNLTPALDSHTAPRRVILLVSPDMKQQAQWLEAVLSRRGIRVMQWPLDQAFDIEHIQQRVLELLEQEKTLLKDKQILLNATGGTKPMSIAAYEIFRSYDLPIFYVHPEKDRVIWLHPNEWENRDLDDRIKLEDFLQAHGVTVDKAPGRNIPDPALLEVGQQIIMEIDRYQAPLGSLNWLAATADKRSLTSKRLQNDKGALRDLIDLFEAHDFLRRKQSTLQFSSEEARFFANGGWLEYLVFDAVRKIRRNDPTIHDVARSVEVSRSWNRQRIPNELDVAFLRNNRLHIIECKTAKLSGHGEDSPGAEVLYKLDTLGDLLGGLQARSMLVSFRAIKKHDLRRAKDLGVLVCAGTELAQLDSHIRKMIV